MICPICGKKFLIKKARDEFEEYFKGEYDYYESFEERFCAECAIKRMSQGINAEQSDLNEDAKSFFESFDENSEEDADRMVSILDEIYDKALNGIPYVSESVEELASDYLLKKMISKKQQNRLLITKLQNAERQDF